MTDTDEKTKKRRLGTAMPLPSLDGKPITSKGDADTYERAERWREWTERLLRLPPDLTATDKEKLPSAAWAIWSTWIDDHHQPTTVLKELLREGRGLTIVGEPGSGKTRLATLVAAAAATWGVWPKLLDAATVRSAAYSDWPEAAKMIKAFSKPKLLILDDLGKSAPSNQGDEIVFAILNERANWQKSTIVTAQYGPERLLTRFNDDETAKGILRRIGPDFNEPIPLKPNS